MAFWEDQPATVRLMGTREVKGETVVSMLYVNENGTPTLDTAGLPQLGMAVVREYNVRIQASNMMGYSHPVVTVVRGRKRQNGPVEILRIYRDGVRLA